MNTYLTAIRIKVGDVVVVMSETGSAITAKLVDADDQMATVRYPGVGGKTERVRASQLRPDGCDGG